MLPSKSTALLLCIGIIFTGCSALFNLDRDLSRHPSYANIINNKFALNHDVFVTECYEIGPIFDLFNEDINLSLKIPGQTNLPYSVTEYENDPLNWKFSDRWAQRGYASKDRSDVIGVARAGTQFQVIKVVLHLCGDGSQFPYIYIKFLNGDHKNYKAKACDLFHINQGITFNRNWIDKL